MRRRSRPHITLTDKDHTRLTAIAAHPSTRQKHVWRARIILALGAGATLAEAARQAGVARPTAQLWRDRFLAQGVDGLLRDATRPPGKAPIPAATVQAIIDLAMSPPPPNLRHWTLKALAAAIGGIAFSTVHTILRRHGLRPHQVKTFKVSNDPRFGIKAHDVIGLYMTPPDHAVVFSVDETTQIQAQGIQGMGRTQTPLPQAPGHPTTRTHDDKRHGTTTLLAALDVATGKVVGQMTERHRSEDFCAFLDHVAAGLAPETEVHVILDNLSAHKSARVHAWLKAHPTWTFHVTPTSASWMNAVEGVFSKLARQRRKNAIFNSLEACITAVEAYIAHHNVHEARPFRWSRDPEDLVVSWKRGHRRLQDV